MIEKIIKGIVLEKIPFENEHIIKILSEGGNIVSLKSKGLDNYKSKNRMSLNIFNLIEVEYFSSIYNSNSGRLKRSSIIKEFLINNNLFLNIQKLIRDLLINLNSHTKLIFDGVINILNSMENNNFYFQKIMSLLILILRNEGYKPTINKCIKCSSTLNIKGFSLYEGGLICSKHEEFNKYKMESKTIKKIIEIYSLINPFECRDLSFLPNEISKLKSMYKMFFENQIGIDLYFINKI